MNNGYERGLNVTRWGPILLVLIMLNGIMLLYPPISIQVSAAETNLKLIIDTEESSGSSVDSEDVLNNKKEINSEKKTADLPQTNDSPGSTLLIIIGILMVAGSIILAIVKLRSRRSDT